MGEFTININADPEIFNRNLQIFVDNGPYYDRLFLDITASNKSVPKIYKKQNGEYRLSYTRPLFYNAFKAYLYDYNYDFVVDEVNPIVVKGKIKLKIFILCFLILFLGICITTLILDFPKDNIGRLLFYLLIPLVIPIYFIRQVKLFKNELTLLLTNLAKNENIN